MSEIRTRTLSPERPKSEHVQTEQGFVRISALFGFRTFGFRTFTVYSKTDKFLSKSLFNSNQVNSKRLKSEHVRISDSSLLFGSNFCSVSNLSEIRTNLFGFQTQICVSNPNRFIPNGTNLFGFQTQVCWISVWNPNKFVRISDILIKPKLSEIQTKTFRFQTVGTKSPNDWNPNVRISDSWDQKPKWLKSERSVRAFWSQLSEIRTFENWTL